MTRGPLPRGRGHFELEPKSRSQSQQPAVGLPLRGMVPWDTMRSSHWGDWLPIIGFYEELYEKALHFYNAAGVPFTATYFNAKGDLIADLKVDIAVADKARRHTGGSLASATIPQYHSLAFLREREVVHSQRFREAAEILKDENIRKMVL